MFASKKSEKTPAALDVRAVYRDHGEFMYRALQRCGVRERDLKDMLQEVLVVVHRRGDSYDPQSAKLRTWLFGICTKVAANHRRRAHVQKEVVQPTEPSGSDTETPEESLRRRQMYEQLQGLLDELSPEKRAVLVMFELEGRSAAQIAEELGLPLGTVHSRLHNARATFKSIFQRSEARERLRASL